MKPPNLTPLTLFLLAIVPVGSIFGRVTWVGDLLGTPLDYAFGVLLISTVVLTWRRAWPAAAAAGFLTALAGVQLISLPALAIIEPAKSSELRVMSFNIYYLNRELDQIAAEVARLDPDIVFLMEYSSDIQAAIEDQFEAYPYRLIDPSRYTMGVALFSKIPMDNGQIHRGQATRIPIVEAHFLLDNRPFAFVGGHPWPPKPRWGKQHRAQFQAMIDVAAKIEGKPLIVAGDFNTAPWSFMVQRMTEEAAVDLVRGRYDYQKTFFVLPGVGLALDHLFVSDGWHVTRFFTGDRGGSDHQPLIIDLALTDAEP